jgi:prevent-host-death family protein
MQGQRLPALSDRQATWTAHVGEFAGQAPAGTLPPTCATLRRRNLEEFSMTEPFDVFTVRDLRNRTGDLMRDAEEGRLSIITKHGRPAILAIPFDERLLAVGVHRSLAVHLFEAGQATLAQAAKLAGLPVERFLEVLGEAGVPAVSYPKEELAGEVESAR